MFPEPTLNLPLNADGGIVAKYPVAAMVLAVVAVVAKSRVLIFCRNSGVAIYFLPKHCFPLTPNINEKAKNDNKVFLFN